MPHEDYFKNTQAFREIAYEMCWVTDCKSVATTTWKGTITKGDIEIPDQTFPVCGHHKKLLETS